MRDELYRQTFGPGSEIFREGEAGDCAYVVDSGTVEISQLRDASEVVLARLGQGELFGEMALIDGQVRSATARAAEPTRLIVVRRDQVVRKLDAADPLLNLILKVILERLRRTNSMLDMARQGAAEEREQQTHDTAYRLVRDRAIAAIEMEQQLHKALDFKELEIFYQPIVATGSGYLAGFEALLRWHDPQQGVVLPPHFVSLAEETGLIVPIGMLALEKACAAAVNLERDRRASVEELPHLFMSVNISARQMAEATIAEDVMATLERTGLAPSRLKLEVTESVLMGDPERATAVLTRLKSRGISIAVDDFGTGYSSLSYLQRFPIDVLKIDRSFVSTMLTDSGNLKIVRALTRLAQELGMTVVAEGVERLEQLALLRELGCGFVQGYLFSPPVALTDAMGLAGRKFF